MRTNLDKIQNPPHSAFRIPRSALTRGAGTGTQFRLHLSRGSGALLGRLSFVVCRSSFIVFSLFALLCLLPALLHAQNPAASLWSTAPRGIPGYNPALLAADEQPKFSYRILGLEVSGGNNAFSFGQYNRFTGAFLDDRAKQEIFGSIPGSGFRVNSTVQADALTLTFANFGLTTRGIAGADANLPRDLFDLALWGNELNRTYSAATLGADAIAYSDLTLAAGIPLASGFSAGIGAKYLRGFAVAQTIQSDGYLTTTPSVINSQVVSAYRVAFGGNGFGLDLGGTYDLPIQNPRSKIRLALAIFNLNLGINWTEGIQIGTVKVDLDSFNLGRIRNPDVASISNTQNQPQPFHTQLPTFISAGAAWQPFHFLTVGASLLEGTANTPLSSTTPRAQISAEFTGLRWLPVSLDAAVGGLEGSTLGCGLGLNLRNFLVQLRVANTRGVINSARGVVLGLNLTYHTSLVDPGSDPAIIDLHSDPSNP